MKDKILRWAVKVGYWAAALCCVLTGYFINNLLYPYPTLNWIFGLVYLGLAILLVLWGWADVFNPFGSKSSVLVERFALLFLSAVLVLGLAIASWIAYCVRFGGEYVFSNGWRALLCAIIGTLLIAGLIVVVFFFNENGYESAIRDVLVKNRENREYRKEKREEYKAHYRHLHPHDAQMRNAYKYFNKSADFKERTREIKWKALKVLIPQTIVLLLPVIWTTIGVIWQDFFLEVMPGWTGFILIVTILVSTFGGAYMFGIPVVGNALQKKHFYTYDVDTTLFGEVYSITEYDHTYYSEERKFYWDIIFFFPVFIFAGLTRIIGILIILFVYRPSSRYILPVPGYVGIERDSRIVPNWVTKIFTVLFGFTLAYDEDKECFARNNK